MRQVTEISGFWDKWNEVKDEIAKKGEEAGKGAELLKYVDRAKQVGVVLGVGVGLYLLYRIVG